MKKTIDTKRRNVLRSKEGYTLMEMMCVILIFTILVGIFYPTWKGWIDRTHKIRRDMEYLIIFQSVQAYTTMNNFEGSKDAFELLNEIGNKPMSSKQNPISQYLYGSVPRDAKIRNISLSTGEVIVEDLQVEIHGTIITIKKPDAASGEGMFCIEQE